MSVATQLGLDDPDRARLLGQARRQWPAWCEKHPALRMAGDLSELPAWLQQAGRAEADDVLHPLAILASPTGGDDVAAAGVLAWLLLPGPAGSRTGCGR